MARIPDEEIERLKQEVSLQRLVEAQGIELKRHGADLLGLCPFHDDHEPSLVVSPKKNLWHLSGWPGNVEWTLYRPDGSQVHHLATGVVELKDRNGNKITITNSSPGGIPTQTMTDDAGRSLSVATDSTANTDKVTMVVYDESGAQNQTLQWTVQWSTITATLPLYQCIAPAHQQGAGYCSFPSTPMVVSQITLPNNLTYSFSYGGRYGEVSSVTLPTGATAAYTWRLDPTGDGGVHCGVACYFDVLANTINKKVLSHDGTSDTWSYTYSVGGTGAILGSAVQAPDGSATGYGFDAIEYVYQASDLAGVIQTISYPDGSITQREWATNMPHEVPITVQFANKFIKRELTTTANASGSPVATSIQVFTADKNGNTTSKEEQGWVGYSANSTPTSATPPRKTVTTYVNGAGDSAVTAADTLAYSNPSFTPGPVNLPASSEVRSAGGTVLARSTFDNQETSPARMGNLVQRWTWDSTKASSIAQGGALDGSKAIGSTYTYSARGNLLTETDPNGIPTTYTYGAVCAGSVSDLYRTGMSRGGASTPVQSWTYSTNCTTGQVNSVTDPNGLVTTITHDGYGRPTSITEGVFRTTTHDYSDSARWVLSQNDVAANADHQNASVIYYDQLWRVRLPWQIPGPVSDPTTAAADEASGIRIQTRYVLSTGAEREHLAQRNLGVQSRRCQRLRHTAGMDRDTARPDGPCVRQGVFRRRERPGSGRRVYHGLGRDHGQSHQFVGRHRQLDVGKGDGRGGQGASVTAVTNWNNSGASVVTYRQYDAAGSVVQATDGRGKNTALEYASSVNTYAFPTKITDAAGYQKQFTWDTYLGQVSESRDQIGGSSPAPCVRYSGLAPLRYSNLAHPLG